MNKENKNLDERFDREWGKEDIEKYGTGLRDSIKHFIRQELDNLAQRFLEAIPAESKIDWSKKTDCYGEAAQESGYNKAIRETRKNFEEIIDLIREKEKNK